MPTAQGRPSSGARGLARSTGGWAPGLAPPPCRKATSGASVLSASAVRWGSKTPSTPTQPCTFQVTSRRRIRSRRVLVLAGRRCLGPVEVALEEAVEVLGAHRATQREDDVA